MPCRSWRRRRLASIPTWPRSSSGSSTPRTPRPAPPSRASPPCARRSPAPAPTCTRTPSSSSARGSRGATPPAASGACTGAACTCATAGTSPHPTRSPQECVGHLREATRRGRIRSTITIFAPDGPAGPGPRVWNEQLIRYAGYRAGGRVLGDPRYVGFTDTARSLGWLPPSPMGRFDVLPLVVSGGGEHAAAGPQFFEVPADAVLEVPLAHAEHPWFADLGLRWHALPVDQQHAPGHRRDLLPGGAVQRLVHGHRDQRPQPRRQRPLRHARRGGRVDGPRHLQRPHALARPRGDRADRRGASTPSTRPASPSPTTTASRGASCASSRRRRPPGVTARSTGAGSSRRSRAGSPRCSTGTTTSPPTPARCSASTTRPRPAGRAARSDPRRRARAGTRGGPVTGGGPYGAERRRCGHLGPAPWDHP